jgi:hypothetical protein
VFSVPYFIKHLPLGVTLAHTNRQSTADHLDTLEIRQGPEKGTAAVGHMKDNCHDASATFTNKPLNALYVHSHVYQYWKQTWDSTACYINPHVEHAAIHLFRSVQVPKTDHGPYYSAKYLNVSFQ